MVTKKKLLENELMKEIVSVRADALWKMLKQKKDGFFPEPYEEGATGKFDNRLKIGNCQIKSELLHFSTCHRLHFLSSLIVSLTKVHK